MIIKITNFKTKNKFKNDNISNKQIRLVINHF